MNLRIPLRISHLSLRRHGSTVQMDNCLLYSFHNSFNWTKALYLPLKYKKCIDLNIIKLNKLYQTNKFISIEQF